MTLKDINEAAHRSMLISAEVMDAIVAQALTELPPWMRGPKPKPLTRWQKAKLMPRRVYWTAMQALHDRLFGNSYCHDEFDY